MSNTTVTVGPNLIISNTTSNPQNSGYVILNAYSICSTAANVPVKTITITNFTIATGAILKIKFTYANTAASPSLSINNGTPIPIYLSQENISPWDDEEVVEMIYDGTQWIVVGYNKIEILSI